MADTATAVAEPKRAEWQALASGLSVGRRGDKDKGADFVPRGETIWLTEEESAGFLDRHPVPVIRPAAQRNEPMPVITARQLFRAQPGPGQFGARPDPAGASRITENPSDPESHPEAQALDVTDPDAHREGETARTRRTRA